MLQLRFVCWPVGQQKKTKQRSCLIKLISMSWWKSPENVPWPTLDFDLLFFTQLYYIPCDWESEWENSMAGSQPTLTHKSQHWKHAHTQRKNTLPFKQLPMSQSYPTPCSLLIFLNSNFIQKKCFVLLPMISSFTLTGISYLYIPQTVSNLASFLFLTFKDCINALLLVEALFQILLSLRLV